MRNCCWFCPPEYSLAISRSKSRNPMFSSLAELANLRGGMSDDIAPWFRRNALAALTSLGLATATFLLPFLAGLSPRYAHRPLSKGGLGASFLVQAANFGSRFRIFALAFSG